MRARGLLAGLLLWACSSGAAEPWRFEVVDGGGQPAPARVSLRGSGGRAFFPEGVNRYRSPVGVPYFYTDGRFELDALGPLDVLVTRGPEFEPLRRRVERGGEVTRLTLERGLHMKERGWYSGDGHVHPASSVSTWPLSNADLLRQMRAEDLNVANLLAANASGDRVYAGDRITGKTEPDSQPDHLLRFSEEYRANTYGHMAVYGVDALSDPVHTGHPGTRTPYDFPTNHDAALLYDEKGAFASFAHLRPIEVHQAAPDAAGIRVPECPVDVALGSLRAIEVVGFGVIPDMALPVWEGLMSAGFDVVITAGTDSFLGRRNQTRMGGARAYVNLEGRPFGYDTWVDQLRRGRAFVTNGAMLFLRVGGVAPGGSLSLSPGETRSVPVEVTVESLVPWETVSVRRMGGAPLVFESATPHRREQRFEGELVLDGPSWVYARVRGPWTPDIAAGGLSGRPEHVAATNAVWVRRGAEERRDRESLDYFVGWIDTSLERLDRRDNYGSAENRGHVRSIFRRARDLLRARAERG